jgi:hypothetical protein
LKLIQFFYELSDCATIKLSLPRSLVPQLFIQPTMRISWRAGQINFFSRPFISARLFSSPGQI